MKKNTIAESSRSSIKFMENKVWSKLPNNLNFEFMDLKILPNSLRAVLRDILEVGNSKPFRQYYQWASTAIYNYANENQITEIVELGAGCAPITRHLTKTFSKWNVAFSITDLNPDILNFQLLEKSDKRVKAYYMPVDFTKKLKMFQNSLLVLSATFHHVPEKQKKELIENLKSISPHLIILEPLQPTISSLIFVCAALGSSLATPICKISSKRFFRCILWCWLLPIAPAMFLWDGWVSAMRCWSKQQWLNQYPQSNIEETLFCTKILIKN